mmetsp:Transcript_19321/g.31645  ORF Transcript_19321/g.31645 Transcript_19321/m.31645 type:complete len:263 (-) Transcript_19321:547-1335(-)
MAAAAKESDTVRQSPESDFVSESDVVKVILLGDSAVGKSKLVERFLMDGYQPQQLSTYALTLFRYNAYIDGKEVPVDFWDTAGQERFNSMHPSYYYRAHACIMVFDVTRKITYKNLENWYKELQDYCKGIPCFVVANKIDLDYNVTKKAFNFAAKRRLPFYFVSASDGTNVVKVFNEAIRAGLKYKDNPSDDFYQQVLDLLADSSLGDPEKFKRTASTTASTSVQSSTNPSAPATPPKSNTDLGSVGRTSSNGPSSNGPSVR